MDPWRIALCALSNDAQVAITDSREPRLKRMLAVSPFLTHDAAVRLLSQRGLHANVAVRALTDPAQLAAAAETKGMRAMWAARNRLTPSTSLAQLAKRTGSPARYWALCNESLDESVSKVELTEYSVATLVRTGGSNADFLSRAVELVEHNWWMAATPDRWPATVRRALALDPRAEAELIHRIREAGPTKWPMFNHRPATPTATMTTAELVAHGGTTTARAALQRPDLTALQARSLVMWHGGEVEAPVIAGTVTRFGVAVADGISASNTKLEAAVTLEPSVAFVSAQAPNLYGLDDTADTAGAILGGNVQGWNVYAALADTGHRNMCEMADAAIKIS